jgi:hypothetical protein
MAREINGRRRKEKKKERVMGNTLRLYFNTLDTVRKISTRQL